MNVDVVVCDIGVDPKSDLVDAKYVKIYAVANQKSLHKERKALYITVTEDVYGNIHVDASEKPKPYITFKCKSLEL